MSNFRAGRFSAASRGGGGGSFWGGFPDDLPISYISSAGNRGRNLTRLDPARHEDR